jgi:hypothetical protein
LSKDIFIAGQTLGMRLQAISHLMQWPALDLRRCHNVGPEIDQKVVVNQCGGTLGQASSAECACLCAVSAVAKSFRKGIRSGGSKKGKGHIRWHWFSDAEHHKNYMLAGSRNTVGASILPSCGSTRACCRQTAD